MNIHRKTMRVAALLALAGVCGAADWPNFLGPDKNGFSPEKGINKDWTAKPPAELWKTPMGDKGFAGPAVAGGRVFIVDHQGAEDVVRAIDIRTGENVWTSAYPDDGKANYGFARSTPAIDQGRVYTLSRLGVLNCMDAKDGKIVWSRNVVKELGGNLPGWQMSMSPLIDGDRVVVCPGGPDAGVAALEKATGKTIWKGAGGDKMGYATPVAATIGGKKQYVVFNGVALAGADAQDGRPLWRVPWKSGYDVNAATPIVLKDEIFITSGYDHGCALVEVSGGEAKIRWENKELKSHFNTPVYDDGRVYGVSDPNALVCVEWKTGNAAWKQAGFEKGGVVAVDGCLIGMAAGGKAVVLAELSPTKYTELGRAPISLAGKMWTAPIVADGKLLVRNEAALICLDLK